MENRVLPQPAEPHSKVGRPSGKPPMGDFIKPGNPGRRLSDRRQVLPWTPRAHISFHGKTLPGHALPLLAGLHSFVANLLNAGG